MTLTMAPWRRAVVVVQFVQHAPPDPTACRAAAPAILLANSTTQPLLNEMTRCTCCRARPDGSNTHASKEQCTHTAHMPIRLPHLHQKSDHQTRKAAAPVLNCKRGAPSTSHTHGITTCRAQPSPCSMHAVGSAGPSTAQPSSNTCMCHKHATTPWSRLQPASTTCSQQYSCTRGYTRRKTLVQQQQSW